MGLKANRESWNRNKREMGGTKMQLEKLKSKKKKKRVFDLSKHGLNKTWDLRQIWSHFGGPNHREREGKRKREKKRKRKRRGRRWRSKKVWNLGFLYGTTWAFKALNGFPCHCMVISCPQT